MANITNHYAPGSCVFQAGSSQNGDIHITNCTFYQGKPEEKDEDKEEGKAGKEEDEKAGKGEEAGKASTPRARTPKPLFPQADNPRREDDAVRQRERDRFKEYLRLHKMGNRELTCTQGDTLNGIVVSFLIAWRKQGCIAENFPLIAVHRFLHDDCGIHSEIEPQSYANKIKDWVKGKMCPAEILAEVEEFMKP